jgi:hypothetical protein
LTAKDTAGSSPTGTSVTSPRPTHTRCIHAESKQVGMLERNNNINPKTRNPTETEIDRGLSGSEKENYWRSSGDTWYPVGIRVSLRVTFHVLRSAVSFVKPWICVDPESTDWNVFHLCSVPDSVCRTFE